MIAQHTGGADEEGQSRDLGRVSMVLTIECTLERGEGGTWDDPGEHGCGEDAQSIWDMAKLGGCVAPRPCQELNLMQSAECLQGPLPHER